MEKTLAILVGTLMVTPAYAQQGYPLDPGTLGAVAQTLMLKNGDRVEPSVDSRCLTPAELAEFWEGESGVTRRVLSEKLGDMSQLKITHAQARGWFGCNYIRATLKNK